MDGTFHFCMLPLPPCRSNSPCPHLSWFLVALALLVTCPTAQLPYTQEEGMYDALLSMTFNAEVRALRDLYEADLVQLVGAFDDFCGIA